MNHYGTDRFCDFRIDLREQHSAAYKSMLKSQCLILWGNGPTVYLALANGLGILFTNEHAIVPGRHKNQFHWLKSVIPLTLQAFVGIRRQAA